ncbi:hypothetical protein ABIE64_002633 [Thalassospira sp. MBR-102]|uniref:hypothetical protein n=1 Tax=Thalassospira sp. MBR-102 TaxID=3156466 RepID=UPI003396408B
MMAMMRVTMKKTSNSKKSASTPQQVGLKYGFRSGLEETVAKQIERAGLKVRFETDVIRYVRPAFNAKYTPDFILENGIIIETKGRFVTEDRQKHLLIKTQHPALDIRFVFSNPNSRISKQSKTTYAMWCDKHGFKYAKGTIPLVWLDEALSTERGDALSNVGINLNA